MKKVENYKSKKLLKKLKLYTKMGKKIIQSDDTEIEKYKFQQYKIPISINDINIDKIVECNKLLFGKQDFKHFIGYKDSENIIPLCIFCPQMIIYIKEILMKIDRFTF